MPATEEELKKAFKAFKKRVKLTQLNDDSKLGHSPLTGKRETVRVRLSERPLNPTR